MLTQLRQRMEHAISVDEAADAAVLIPITQECNPRVILTVRSATLKSHAGEVAFPGGKRDPQDLNLQQTALRETFEEIELDPAAVEIIGPGPERTSRFGLRVRPFVGLVQSGVNLKANPQELQEVFSVPLAFFLQRSNLRIERIVLDGRERDLPWYPWGKRQVWGLTALMLIDVLNTVFDYGVELRS
jgi:8-oxo-dGTP pyrophosphatase MutT (NUDIX family)